MEIGSADGFADADFMGALGDRDEHNIHDADTANNKGDTSDNREDFGSKRKKAISRMGELIAKREREVRIGFGAR